jgi:FKBP-type peptidyl-prolyl cis-trans isomerase
MHKPRRIYLIIGIIVLLAGALAVLAIMNRDQYFFKRTSTGLAYKIKEKGQGPSPTAGQILLLEMMYRTKDNQVIFNSDERGFPTIVPYDEIVGKADGSIYEAIGMLQKGDKYIFRLPAKTLLGVHFETLAAQHKLKEHTPLYLHLYLKDMTTQEGIQELEAAYFQAMMQRKQEKAAEQLPKDIEAINAYLHNNQLQAMATPSGLRYRILTPGQGAHPQAGDIVSVNYIGRTLDGQVFDTNLIAEAKQHNLYDASRSYEPMQFTIGQGSMIPGFEEGIKLLNKHAKASLFVPSVLAYGELDLSPHIKPHASLIFDVEVVDIQQGKTATSTQAQKSNKK